MNSDFARQIRAVYQYNNIGGRNERGVRCYETAGPFVTGLSKFAARENPNGYRGAVVFFLFRVRVLSEWRPYINYVTSSSRRCLSIAGPQGR